MAIFTAVGQVQLSLNLGGFSNNNNLDISQYVNDFADGAYVQIEFPNDIVTRTPGRNGTMFATNFGGLNADLTFRIMKGNLTEKKILSQTKAQWNDLASAGFVSGTLTARFQSSNGEANLVTYIMNGGEVSRYSNFEGHSDGNTDNAATATYKILFGEIIQLDS